MPAGSQTHNLDVRDEIVVQGRVVVDNVSERTAGSGVTLADNLVVSDATNSTSGTTGAIRTAGGLGVVQDMFIGGLLEVTNDLVGDADPLTASTEIRGVEPASVDSRTVHGVLRVTYDFAVDGGTGIIVLGGTEDVLPINAVVTRAYYDVTSIVDSPASTATFSLGIPDDDPAGILAAAAVSGIGTVGVHETIQVGTALTFSNKTQAARAINMIVAVQDIDEGHFVLFVEYYVSE